MAELYREIKSSLFRGMVETGISCDESVESRFRQQLGIKKRLFTWQSYPEIPCIGIDNRDFGDVSKTVFAYGCLISEEFCWMANLTPRQTKTFSLSGGWFNLGISLYDFILDEIPDLSIILKSQFTAAVLSEWIKTNRAPRLPLENHPIFELLWKAISEVIGTIHNQGLSANPVLWNEIKKSLLIMHSSESYLSDAGFPRTVTKNSRQNVLAKSALPFWVMTMLVAGNAVSGRIQEWKKFSMYLGELYALVDDGIDISIDANRGKMNLILLDVARKRPEWFDSEINANYRLQLIRLYISQSDLIFKNSKFLCTKIQEYLRYIQKDIDVQKMIMDRVAGSVMTWYG